MSQAHRVFRDHGIKEVVKQSLRYFKDCYLIVPFGPIVSRSFLNARDKTKDLGDYLDLAYSWSSLGFNIKPLTVRSEIAKFLDMVSRRPPMNRILEIGTANGGTLYLLGMVSFGGQMISVDVRNNHNRARILFKHFTYGNIYVHNGSSHDPYTKDFVQYLLVPELLDLLFIDGDHSYEGVKKDFEMYSPLVKKGGIIALDDCSPCKYSEVSRFWNEIKDNYQSMILEDVSKEGCGGIGVIFV